MIDLKTIDVENITPEQLLNLKNVLKVGEEHLTYFEQTAKHFKFPERRMKTFDTVFYERVVPEIKTILKNIGHE